MSDILIKGMEMPKRCTGCFNSKCLLFFEHTDPNNSRHPNCPLVEVPPHGEAKDTDIAIRYIKDEMEDDFNKTTTLDEKSYKEGMKRAIELIGYAPTVLEANNE